MLLSRVESMCKQSTFTTLTFRSNKILEIAIIREVIKCEHRCAAVQIVISVSFPKLVDMLVTVCESNTLNSKKITQNNWIIALRILNTIHVHVIKLSLRMEYNTIVWRCLLYTKRIVSLKKFHTFWPSRWISELSFSYSRTWEATYHASRTMHP